LKIEAKEARKKRNNINEHSKQTEHSNEVYFSKKKKKKKNFILSKELTD
jgi:hypothetical protein